MDKVIRFIAIAVAVLGLTACGDLDRIDAGEANAARIQKVLDGVRLELAEVKSANTKLRADLNAEVKAKLTHAVREEKFKNLHEQAVADHATALNKLRACQNTPQPKGKKK